MILDQIVEDKRKRLIRDKERISLQQMRSLAEEACSSQRRSIRSEEAMECGGEVLLSLGDVWKSEDSILSPVRAAETFYDQLRKPGISIIGEFKRASPSLGTIDSRIDLDSRIKEYNGSVDAISCLTEEDHFHGNIGFLRQIRKQSPLPILRKDFMIEEYQFYEARVIGADAVLLIAAILDDAQMGSFYQLARELELDVLVEVHDEKELMRALRIGPRIIGVNNRNLKDFSISLENTERLRPLVPKDRVMVAESGIMGEEDVARLKNLGVDAFLIGRALMESANPMALARSWKGQE